MQLFCKIEDLTERRKTVDKHKNPKKKASIVSQLSDTDPTPPKRQALQSPLCPARTRQAQTRGPPLSYRYEACSPGQVLLVGNDALGLRVGSVLLMESRAKPFPSRAQQKDRKNYAAVSSSSL